MARHIPWALVPVDPGPGGMGDLVDLRYCELQERPDPASRGRVLDRWLSMVHHACAVLEQYKRWDIVHHKVAAESVQVQAQIGWINQLVRSRRVGEVLQIGR
jgi:hypothetical protein